MTNEHMELLKSSLQRNRLPQSEQLPPSQEETIHDSDSATDHVETKTHTKDTLLEVASTDPRLARLNDAWDTLPEHIKAAVEALVSAANC